MKKFLLAGSVTALLLPAFVFAASDTVTLTTDVTLNIGGITVNVTGTSATLSSIVVSGSTFAVTVQSGSYLKVVAPNGNALDESLSAAVTHNRVCNSTTSSYEIIADATATVTITPASDTCASRSTSSSSSSSSSGNGPVVSSGGGGGGGYTPPLPAATVKTTTSTGSASQIAALQAQIQALLAQIAGAGGSGTSKSFSRDLKAGSTGQDVKALQVYLNTHGFAIASSGAGSAGYETTRFGGATRAALIKFQKSVGISPAAGYFGAKTRAYIAAHQ